jgi:flavin prenyltransferase
VTSNRIIVGMTGAIGAIYGVRLLEVLAGSPFETHLVASEWARKTISIETGRRPDEVFALAHRTYRVENQAAAISSGSFLTAGMVIAPCSMKTLAAIHSGYGEGLVPRAADVTLKERRKLVLVPRESPLSEVHLRNMLGLARLGVVISPPMPAFYLKPDSVEDIVDHVVGRVLDQFGLELPDLPRWTGRPRANRDGGAPWT